MGYLVRKFKDLENKNLINSASDVDSIIADVLKEFQTCDNGDLSTWRIDKITDLEKAFLPIAITNTQICELNVILIDEDLLLKYNFSKQQESSKEDNIINCPIDKMHYNIKNITIGNIKNCVALYWETMDKDQHKFTTYTKKFADFEVADIILNAFKNNIITKEQIRCIKSLRKSFPELIAKAGVQL